MLAPKAQPVLRRSEQKWLSPVSWLWAGLAVTAVGTLDPLEGSVLIVPGLAMMTTTWSVRQPSATARCCSAY
jgi:hypothetical protein